MNKQHIVISMVLLSTTTACAPLILGGAAAVGYAAVQEKGASVVVKDTSIKTHIKDKLTGIDYRFLTQVEVSVLEGDVFLTGVVGNNDSKAVVESTVRDIKGVKAVYNELLVGDYPKGTYSKDVLLATQIKGRLLTAKDVYSVNYSVRVVKGVVYLVGLAETQSEIERALHIVRTAKGVQKVVNYMRISKK